MALKMVLDTLDGLDDHIKPLYVEHEGKFKLAVDGLEDTSGLKSALEKERKARRDAEAKAKSALGSDELEEFERLRAEAAKSKGAEELVGQIKSRHEREIQAEKQRSERLQRSLENTLITATATEVLAKHGGNVGLLMPHISKAIKVEAIDDNFSVVPSDAASIDEVVTTLKKNFPAAFSDGGQSGSGANGGKGSGGSGELKTSVQRIAAGLKSMGAV